MRNIMLLLGVFLLSLGQIQAQNNDKGDENKENFRYKGLLWEITGNGLKDTSYLYGTMHVSRKIAFNLDDVFFEALDKSDMVAVESRPDRWLDFLFEDGKVGYTPSYGGYYGGYGNRNFYSSAFKMNFPDKMDIVRSMFGQYQLINGLLYRSEGRADFEEDTYLDMFIYQTGKRFDKATFSLEDYHESRDLVDQAYKDFRKKEVDEWLTELVEKKGVRQFEITQDAYRDRNIGLIDSINRAMYTDNYMEHMLFKRNENMVDSMETLMRKGSLFTGVGAAHLPGDDGMIDMLRKRGYTLRPLFSDQTDKGKKLKTKFEDNFIEKEYTPQTTEDGFITVNCPNKIYELYSDAGSICISPDYDNGSYVTVTRLYTFNTLREKAERLDEEDLEKLLFEFIPGEILSKKVIDSPYPGFDIQNETKTGNHQRYLFYVTPIEIIIIKMDGKKDFVKRESEKVFPSIKFNGQDVETRSIASNFNGFNVEMPGYTIINNSKYSGKRFLQAYNSNNGDYAFLTENNLHDYYYIEEDSFELHYMAEQFCENLDTKLDENGVYEVKNGVPTFVSYTVLDSAKNQKLHLSTKLLGERFYLLGYVGDETNANEYFDATKITPFSSYKNLKFEEQEDTNLHYIVHAPDRLPVNNYNYGGGYYKKDDDKDYEGYSKNQIYSINSNEQVSIGLIKYHDWKMYDNIDSLWSSKREDFRELKMDLEKEKVYEKDSTYFFEGRLVRRGDNSSRAVKFKYIQKDGTLYSLRTLVPQDEPLSPFIDTFFQTFTPMDTVIGISPLSDKTGQFFTAIENQDSILLGSSDYIRFEDEHFDRAKKLFLEKEFDEDWEFLRDQLLDEICTMSYSKTKTFLEKLYLDSYENSDYQFQILSNLIYQNTKEANTKVLALLEQDIPISDDGGSFIWRLLDSAELAMPMFPALLDYANIPDYKYEIQGVLSKLVKYYNLSPRKYKSFKKQFLNEAKIELKRAIGKKSQSKSRNDNYYRYNYDYYDKASSTSSLTRYIDLLYPFRKDSKVKDFLDKAQELEDEDVQLNFIELALLNGETPDKAAIQTLAEDEEHRFEVYSLLKMNNRLDLMVDSLKDDLVILQGFLGKKSYYNETVDTLYHIGTETIDISGKDYKVYFFFEQTTKEDNYYNDSKEKSSIIAMTHREKYDELDPDNYYNISEEIEDDETQEEVIKNLRKRLQLRDRKRISGDSGYRNNNYYDY